MKSTEIQDTIDNYLLDKMNDAEKNDFERELSTNAELKEKVGIQKLIVDEIRNRAVFNKIVGKTIKEEKRHVQFRRTMYIAWSAAAIFIGVFFINQTVVNNRMDNLYTEMYTAPGESNYRGKADVQEIAFNKAVNYLKLNQPKQAEEALMELYTLPDTYSYYEAVRWYLALTELKLHHKTEVKKYLNELVDSEFYGEKVNKILEKL